VEISVQCLPWAEFMNVLSRNVLVVALPVTISILQIKNTCILASQRGNRRDTQLTTSGRPTLVSQKRDIKGEIANGGKSNVSLRVLVPIQDDP